MIYESIQILIPRKNGIRLIARKEKRSMAQQLDFFLEKAGVPKLSDEELQKKLKQCGEEILVAGK